MFSLTIQNTSQYTAVFCVKPLPGEAGEPIQLAPIDDFPMMQGAMKGNFNTQYVIQPGQKVGFRGDLGLVFHQNATICYVDLCNENGDMSWFNRRVYVNAAQHFILSIQNKHFPLPPE